jgi:hypothetical protein
MKTSIRSILFVFAILVIVVSACAPGATPPPTSVPPTSTPLPTSTPMPTYTVAPTKTPIPPTATVPAPDKVSEYLNGAAVTLFEPFGKNYQGGWWFDTGKLTSDNVTLPGTDSWSGFGRDESRKFSAGEGYLIDFTYSKGSVFEMLFQHEKFYTDPYRRFGIYIDNAIGKSDLWQGKTLFANNLHGNLVLHPDTTYTVLMAILEDREFLAVVWNKSDPAKTLYYREKLGSSWADLSYTLSIGANKGTILFNNYQEIKFDSAK